MSEDRLVLDVKKSIYDPIEIPIKNVKSGKQIVFKSIKITRAIQKQLAEIDQRYREAKEEDAKIGIMYEQINLVFGTTDEILDQLDVREVEDIIVLFQNSVNTLEQKRLKAAVETLEKTLGPKAVQRIPSKNRKGPGKKR